MKSKMTLDKIAEIAGNHGVGSPDHFTCLIRISINLKNDQKNRPHDSQMDFWKVESRDSRPFSHRQVFH